MVSLLTELSSGMITPLLPVFLTATLGAGAVALGTIEGVAESAASLLKLLSGAWSDRTARRKPWLVVGYTLAGVARPLIGVAGDSSEASARSTPELRGSLADADGR